MAITIHNTPQAFTPSDNPIIWTFSSDQTGQPNFYYLVSTFINNIKVQENIVTALSGINAKWNAAAVAKLHANIPVLSDDLATSAENSVQVKIEVTERYGDPVADGATVGSSNIRAYKAKLRKRAFEAWDYTNYNTKFLTEFPTTINPKVRWDEQMRLLILNQNEDITITYKLFNSGGGTIASDTYTHLNSDPFTIINVNPEKITDGTTITQANFEAADYFTVKIVMGANTITGHRIDMNTNRRYRRAKRLDFITGIGAIESISFDDFSKEKYNVEDYGYQKHYGELDGQIYDFDVNKGINVSYCKTEEGIIKIESDWLDEETTNWLVKELYLTPAVWIEAGINASDLFRTKVLTKNYATVTRENDMLTREVIECALIPETSMVV